MTYHAPVPRKRAKAPDPLPAGLPSALREELREAIDFAEQEAERGQLDSAALRLEGCAEALGRRLAALVVATEVGGSEREVRATAEALLGLRASADAFQTASDAAAARASARTEEAPLEAKMDAIRRAVAAVEHAIEQVPTEQEVPDLTLAVDVLRRVVRGQVEPTSRKVVTALGEVEEATRHQVLPALGDLRRAHARAAVCHALSACGARVAAEATIYANDAEACAHRGEREAPPRLR
jgi:predicted DNA-binding protein